MGSLFEFGYDNAWFSIHWGGSVGRRKSGVVWIVGMRLSLACDGKRWEVSRRDRQRSLILVFEDFIYNEGVDSNVIDSIVIVFKRLWKWGREPLSVVKTIQNIRSVSLFYRYRWLWGSNYQIWVERLRSHGQFFVNEFVKCTQVVRV